jgi:hypothetical protein
MDADALRDDLEHKRDLIKAYTRRQRKLEQQAAHFGPHTPAHISIELDEVNSAIAALEREIAVLEGRAVVSAPQGASASVTGTPAVQRSGVALDLSHQQRKWDRFAAFASQPAWQFQLIDKGIFQQRITIDHAAALLLVLPFDSVLTGDEIDYLDNWVLAGGGLFLLGNYAADTHHMSNPSAVARKFGLQFGNDLVLPAERESETDARIQPRSLNADLAVKIALMDDPRHPILHGIGEVAFLSACSVEIIADPEGTAEYLLHAPATSAVMRPRGVVDEDGWMPVIERWELARHDSAPLLAACRYGKGRVVAAGSRKICTLDYGDNLALVRNILAWLIEG